MLVECIGLLKRSCRRLPRQRHRAMLKQVNVKIRQCRTKSGSQFVHCHMPGSRAVKDCDVCYEADGLVNGLST